MSVLAFKAIGYGAEQIPDKFFEKIPGGFFTPAEKKQRKDARDRKERARHRSEERSSRRSSRRDGSPRDVSPDYSAHNESDYEYERERRKKDRSRRAKSVGRSSSRSLSRGRHNQRNSDVDGQDSETRDMAYAGQGEPYFPPPPTSEYRPYNPQAYASERPPGTRGPASPGEPYGYPPPQPAAVPPPHSSASAARYTPGPGYAPSPLVNTNIPAVPTSPYAPYNPSEYAGGYQAPGNAYPSPPPLNRQRSNSQPASPPYPTYIPPSADQRMAAYDSTTSRRGSTKPRREHRHRARSADSHSSSRRASSRNRDSSHMTKMRERFDEGFARDSSGLAAAVGGALAGGLAGRQLGKSRLTAFAGAAAGALGGQAIANKRSKSRGARSPSRDRSRSRSRSRRHDDHDRPSGIRARSRSIIDRFRSKSRGPEDRDSRKDRYDSRPDHGYDRSRGDDYDYFSSESEGDGSPVRTRRHRRR